MNTDTPDSTPIRTSIAPWLSVSQATQALHFYQAAFGANESYRLEDETGKLAVAQLTIAEANFWLQEDHAASPNSSSEDHPSVHLILTVADPDALFAQAISAGATEVYAITEEHGWRIGRLIDPFGYHWEIGRPLH
ncbi:hypothetical protein KDH_77560 [Dictyobacter sp. S3.2.2.5]|uniref:VOC domain-containing protein n=1 Tax=Dictyobacter halimunensis TaxID=3026934 RepID=A0ABQ6G4A0_9CHLR|nr:hypothetical protein KDH_77560 [Dictyobacter sp. S3.2.2.5]